MKDLVDSQSSTLTKPFAALTAFERFLFAVNISGKTRRKKNMSLQ